MNKFIANLRNKIYNSSIYLYSGGDVDSEMFRLFSKREYINNRWGNRRLALKMIRESDNMLARLFKRKLK